METCYEILGVSRDATPDEIRAAYRRLAKQYHPDINQDPDANERFIAIQQAYETLIDPEARARYDIALQGGAGPAPHDPFRYRAAGGSGFSWSWQMPESGAGRTGLTPASSAVLKCTYVCAIALPVVAFAAAGPR